MYETMLADRPQHAPTLINLGTIHYNLRQYEKAEELYRRATVADPEYALAFFDLGNVLDELQRLSRGDGGLSEGCGAGSAVCRCALQPGVGV